MLGWHDPQAIGSGRWLETWTAPFPRIDTLRPESLGRPRKGEAQTGPSWLRSEESSSTRKENRVEREATAEIHRQAQSGVVLAAVREDRLVSDVCREHQIQEALYHCGERAARGRAERCGGKEERAGEKDKDKRIAELERVLVGRWSWRSRERRCEVGSERVRRSVSQTGRRGLSRGDHGAHHEDQLLGDLPTPRRRQAATRRPVTDAVGAADRRRRRAQPA